MNSSRAINNTSGGKRKTQKRKKLRKERHAVVIVDAIKQKVDQKEK